MGVWVTSVVLKQSNVYTHYGSLIVSMDMLMNSYPFPFAVSPVIQGLKYEVNGLYGLEGATNTQETTSIFFLPP